MEDIMTTGIINHEDCALEVIDNSIDSQAAEDFEEARRTYKDLIETGKQGIDVAFTLVEASEHPRAIEVFSGLLSNIANINSKLIELHKIKKDIVSFGKKESNGKQITNNNMFVGSPKDLLDMLGQNNV